MDISKPDPPSLTEPMFLVLVVLVLLASGCGTYRAAEPSPPGAQEARHFAETRERTLESGYLLFLPESYAPEGDTLWPLIVHLHGGGGRGADPERLRVYPLAARVDEEPDFPFVVLSPQCPPGRPGPLGDLWTEHAELVLAMIDRVVEEHRIDPDRIYLVGHSMGGYGTWYLGHRAPERFAALAPVAGPGATWWTYRIAEAGIPVWVFHGERDDAVPIAEAERMVAALEEAGGDVRFTRYPEGGHVLREPWQGDELYDWLLSHRRPGS
jgi:predicted peptidase